MESSRFVVGLQLKSIKGNLNFFAPAIILTFSGSRYPRNHVYFALSCTLHCKLTFLYSKFLISGIKRAFVNTEKDNAGRIVIVTEGINILEVWKHHEIVDTSDLYTNDINTLVFQ